MRHTIPAVLLLACIAAATPANAQCAGDCNQDGTVLVNELITAVNIALGLAPLANCTAADRDGDGTVVVSELIQGVNSALNGCIAVTPTSTPDTRTATPTATAPASCGNGRIEFTQGETCDDGNREEGPEDSCPANCRIGACVPSGETLTAEVVFETDPVDLLVGGLTLFVRYPDGVVSVPGTGNEAPVQEAISSDFFSITPNDLDYALVTVLIDPLLLGVNGGTAIRVDLDRCTGASLPPASAFECRVVDAADIDFNTVTDQVTCGVLLP